MHKGAIINLQDSSKVPPWILDPLSKPRMAWDVASIFLIAFQLVLIPAEVAFAQPTMTLSEPFNVWWWLEFVVGMFFFGDLILNSITGYIKLNGLVVRQPRLILRHYFLEFPCHGMCDIVSLVPWLLTIVEIIQYTMDSDEDSILSVLRTSRFGRFGRYFRLLRLLRLMRISNAIGIVRRISMAVIFSGRYASTAASVFKLAMAFLLIIHFVSCVYGYAADDFDGQALGDGSPYSPDGPLGAWEKYSFAVWWVVTTLAGGSPPTDPESTGDLWLWSIISFFFVVCTNMMVGIVCAVFDHFFQAEAGLHDQLEVTMRYMTLHNLHDSLKSRVIQSVRTAFAHQSIEGNFETKVDPLLSDDLRRKIKGAIFGDMLRRFPPFSLQQVPAPFLSTLASEGTYCMYVTGDTLFREGDAADAMVFLTSGAALIHSDSLKFKMPHVERGWWLHEQAVFPALNAPHMSRKRPFTCVASEPCSALWLTKDLVEAALEYHHCSLRSAADGTAVEPPHCPVCGDGHEAWQCQVLIAVDSEDEDENDGGGKQTHLVELGQSSKRTYCAARARMALAKERGARAEVPPAKAAEGPKPEGVEVAVAGMTATLHELVAEVRSLHDRMAALEKRKVARL